MPLAGETASLLLLEPGKRQGAGAITPLGRVMDERLFAAVGDPDFVRCDLGDGRGELVPVGVVGDDEGQFDAARLGALAKYSCISRSLPLREGVNSNPSRSAANSFKIAPHPSPLPASGARESAR